MELAEIVEPARQLGIDSWRLALDSAPEFSYAKLSDFIPDRVPEGFAHTRSCDQLQPVFSRTITWPERISQKVEWWFRPWVFPVSVITALDYFYLCRIHGLSAFVQPFRLGVFMNNACLLLTRWTMISLEYRSNWIFGKMLHHLQGKNHFTLPDSVISVTNHLLFLSAVAPTCPASWSNMTNSSTCNSPVIGRIFPDFIASRT